jgi:signal transduction histidine kinase/HAMP domain-containing protein
VTAASPGPPLRLRLRTKLAVAMGFAALVPVLVVALLATGVILSSLETSLREDADRQLGIALNLVLRSVERLGDEAVRLSETSDLAGALGERAALEAWLAREAVHASAARLQLLDAAGRVVFTGELGGGPPRLEAIEVRPGDPVIAIGQAWGRGVALVEFDDHLIARAVSPVVDAGLALRGVLVLSMPLDGDFANGIKGALSAEVLLGGPSGKLETTLRTGIGGRTQPLQLADADRAAALRGKRVIRDLDLVGGQRKIATTALFDRKDHPIGLVGVAVDRTRLEATKLLAVRSLVAGGLAALAFALVLALFWSRRLGAPIAELHDGAIAVSRGDLDHRIDIPGGDELTDLAIAFNQMTSTLQDNQARLAARMREIVAIHDAGRAVSSVIDMEGVSRKIVEAVARTFDIQLAALWLVDERGEATGAGAPHGDEGEGAGLRVTAARARRADVSTAFATDEALATAEVLRPFADQARATRRPLRLGRASPGPGGPSAAAGSSAAVDRSAASGPSDSPDPRFAEAARQAGGLGPVVALPLDRKARVVGVIAVARTAHAREFSEAELNLLTTFADQAGAAVENALLYSEVRAASEGLERKVRMRTIELTTINYELHEALENLRETQAQLVLSERMAGLGLLVAGVAHEINSPTAAIRGSIDGLTSALARVSRHGVELAARSAPAAVAGLLEALAPALAERPLPTSLTARKAAREIAAALEVAAGPSLERLPQLAAELADLGATPDDAVRLIDALGASHGLASAVVAALTDHVYLHRTASTIRHAIASIQRIVGALKSYSHLDQQAVRTEADIHEGLETTLTLLHHTLRDIVVERRFGSVPRIPVYVDELNQVWTNLIQNAQQALSNRPPSGARITITTETSDAWVVVCVTDNGPGVPTDVLPRIFEPFFTTKPKGEGSGLGLGIARKIVDKHGGTMRCESEPGWTMFEVRLPIAST